MRALPTLQDLSAADLNGDLAIFPLLGALLLPRGRLPLNIFEPRFVAMVDDALRSRRLIGMVQPQGVPPEDDDEADDDDSPDVGLAAVPPNPALYQVGCVGRLTSFVERQDGTYAVTLAGIARFRVEREIEPLHGYRRIIPDFSPYIGDMVEPEPAGFDRDALIEALRRFFSLRGFEARWEAIEQMDDETLVITLSMICPFAVAEKQALLEAPTLKLRARTLLTLLQMAGHETGFGGAPHTA